MRSKVKFVNREICLALSEKEAEVLLFLSRLTLSVPEVVKRDRFDGTEKEVKDLLDDLRIALSTYDLNKRGW